MLETPGEYYKQKRSTREIEGMDVSAARALSPTSEAIAKRE
jgi:hypothetical protein